MWSIACTVNTVKIPDKCAKELFRAQDWKGELWSESEDVRLGKDAYKKENVGTLTFNEDHREHMDYLGTHPKILAILKKHKVQGDICFGSLEGDNAGEFWGYRFDGRGGMKELTGTLVYEES